MSPEIHATRVSLFGRVADALSRATLRAPDFSASLEGQPRARPIYKPDGFFVFTDLDAPASYTVVLRGRGYGERRLTLMVAAGTATEVTAAGEDELWIRVIQAANPISFPEIAVLRPIVTGSRVIAAGGATTLEADLGGAKVSRARLADDSIAAPDGILRFVRSNAVLLPVAPGYPFPSGLTVVAVHVHVQGSPGTPLANAEVELDEVEGVTIQFAPVGGAPVPHVTFQPSGQPAPTTFVLTSCQLRTSTNARGDAILFVRGDVPLTALRLRFRAPGGSDVFDTLSAAAGARTHHVRALAA